MSDGSVDWRSLHGGFFQRVRVLITGGAGVIGSHLTEALVSLGASVVVLDDLSGGSRDNLNSFEPVEFVEGSILDRQTVASCMGGCDYAFHEAALGSVPRSVAVPRTYHDVNGT